VSNKWHFERRLKKLNESATLTKSGRWFQIVGGATRKAWDAVTVTTRCGTISKSELDERSVLAGLYEMSPVSKPVAGSFLCDTFSRNFVSYSMPYRQPVQFAQINLHLPQICNVKFTDTIQYRVAVATIEHVILTPVSWSIIGLVWRNEWMW